jgi:hypothetical protein
MDYNKLKGVIIKKPISFILVFFGYILVNALINKTYVMVPDIYSSFPFWFATIFLFVNLLFVPFLVSLTLNLSFEKLLDLKDVVKGKGMFSFIGIFGTLLGGACPGCFVGLFPAFVGLFGSAFTLSSLPFYGLEIQALSSIILIISLHYLTRRTICKI